MTSNQPQKKFEKPDQNRKPAPADEPESESAAEGEEEQGDWNLEPRKPGMRGDMKVGLVLIMLLLAGFGGVVYLRMTDRMDLITNLIGGAAAAKAEGEENPAGDEDLGELGDPAEETAVVAGTPTSRPSTPPTASVPVSFDDETAEDEQPFMADEQAPPAATTAGPTSDPFAGNETGAGETFVADAGQQFEADPGATASTAAASFDPAAEAPDFDAAADADFQPEPTGASNPFAALPVSAEEAAAEEVVFQGNPTNIPAEDAAADAVPSFDENDKLGEFEPLEETTGQAVSTTRVATAEDPAMTAEQPAFNPEDETVVFDDAAPAQQPPAAAPVAAAPATESPFVDEPTGTAEEEEYQPQRAAPVATVAEPVDERLGGFEVDQQIAGSEPTATVVQRPTPTISADVPRATPGVTAAEAAPTRTPAAVDLEEFNPDAPANIAAESPPTTAPRRAERQPPAAAPLSNRPRTAEARPAPPAAQPVNLESIATDPVTLEPVIAEAASGESIANYPVEEPAATEAFVPDPVAAEPPPFEATVAEPARTAPRTATTPRTAPRTATTPRQSPVPRRAAPVAENPFEATAPPTTAPRATSPRATTPRTPAPRTAAIAPTTDPANFQDPAQPAAGQQVYTVQPNENYWTISRKVYGSARYFQALAKHNEGRIPDPRKMKPGMQLAVPPKEVLLNRYPTLISQGAPATPIPTEETGYFVSKSGAPMYRVGPEDTLTSISQQTLGRASRWPEILELNGSALPSPDRLKIGTVLQLPSDASGIRFVGNSTERR